MRSIATCSVSELYQLLSFDPHTQVIDVREYSEHAAERLPAAKLFPLSSLDQHVSKIDPQLGVYVLCRSGARAAQAANKLAGQGINNLTVVEGGLMAWKEAGFPVELGTSKVWSLERQVRFTAYFVHPYFIALSGFIGAGLVFSSVTDTCSMGLVLAKMPWNQKPASSES
jgi:rhodanese-related sulfurtransferase